MGHDDKVPPDRLAEVRPIARERTSDEWREVFLQSRDLCLSEDTAAVLSDLVTALLSDMVTELEDRREISAPRVQAILHGEGAKR
jgi:hypothetical protein